MKPISSSSRGSGALSSVLLPPPQKKNIYIYSDLGFYKLQKAPFHVLDFDIFLTEHDPGPL